LTTKLQHLKAAKDL